MAAVCTAAFAQNGPAPSATTRTVVAATKLPISADKPLSFRATSIALARAQKDTISAADGILYQVSGSTEVSVGAGEQDACARRRHVHPRRNACNADGAG